jgi:hypothetical protein
LFYREAADIIIMANDKLDVLAMRVEFYARASNNMC